MSLSIDNKADKDISDSMIQHYLTEESLQRMSKSPTMVIGLGGAGAKSSVYAKKCLMLLELYPLSF